MRGDPRDFVRAGKRQEVYSEPNYLLGLVLILPQAVTCVGDAVVRILSHKEKDKNISLTRAFSPFPILLPGMPEMDPRLIEGIRSSV